MAENDPSLKALLPESGQETTSEAATATDDNADDSSLEVEVKNMSDTQAAPELTAEDIATAMGAQFTKALEPVVERLQAVEDGLKVKPENDDGGTDIKVVKDEVDRDLDANPFQDHW